MTKRNVSKIHEHETLPLGSSALVVGPYRKESLLSLQFMMFRTAHMFNTTLDSFKFVPLAAALIQTVISFLYHVCVALIFNVATVSRYKLIDLLNADKVTLTVMQETQCFSTALLGLSWNHCLFYILLQHNGLNRQMTSLPWPLPLVSVGTALFLLLTLAFCSDLCRCRRASYYKGLHSLSCVSLTPVLLLGFRPSLVFALCSGSLWTLAPLLACADHERQFLSLKRTDVSSNQSRLVERRYTPGPADSYDSPSVVRS